MGCWCSGWIDWWCQLVGERGACFASWLAVVQPVGNGCVWWSGVRCRDVMMLVPGGANASGHGVVRDVGATVWVVRWLRHLRHDHAVYRSTDDDAAADHWSVRTVVWPPGPTDFV